MVWKTARGLLGPLSPLIGRWKTEARPGATRPADAVGCVRVYEPFGKGWVRLQADWSGQASGYREIALYGRGDDGELAFFSFTSDGKRSQGRRADGSDVHPLAVAFEARMPAGLARMSCWPRDDGRPGFDFAVESKVKAGWNRFLHHRYGPAD